jgi:hypothetical protein
MCIIGTLIKKLIRSLCGSNMDEHYTTQVMDHTPYIVDYESQRTRERLNARQNARMDDRDHDDLMRMWNQRKATFDFV